ncbi:MAG TPA: lipopolysaccharide biosynthesis protein RfbH [Thermoleophilia bacterium]|nr:lipopolysaccharide biosynthesis protein RfbH [Thermoleophilia bacterium]
MRVGPAESPRRATVAPGTDPDRFAPGVSRVPYAGRVFGAEELTCLVDAALDFWLTHGRYADRFERELGGLLGAARCLLVNSGSSANLLAFAALTSERLGARRVRPGDEVVTVAAGFPTTVAPIVQFGAVPVFVDVELDTANVDVEQLEAAVSRRTKAVMLAHTLGNPFDLDAVRGFCRAHDLWLIEDNCDALGSRYRGRLTGTFGDIATSSFYPPHHLTLGEGGAVYTSDEELGTILASLRDWGRDCSCPPGHDDSCGRRFSHDLGELPYGYDHKYVFSEFGYNLKATDLQAAVGCAQLARLGDFTARRRENHARLAAALESVADLFVLPRATDGCEPSWFGFLFTLRAAAIERGLTRDALVAALERRRIQTRMLFAGNMVRQPCFDGRRAAARAAALAGTPGEAGYRVVGDLAVTDRLMNDAVWVGVYPGLTAEMIDFVAAEIIAFCRA